MKRRFSMGWLLLLLWVLYACSTSGPPVDVIDSPNQEITFEIIGSETLVFSQTIEDDLSAFELLQLSIEKNNVHLKYAESEFGIFIEELFDIKPPLGSYIMISLNGVPLNVGITDAVFEATDVFTFELEFWDSDAALRYQAINDFLKAEAQFYLNNNSYEVYTALGILGFEIDVPALPVPLTENDFIRATLIFRSLNQEVEILQGYLAELYTTELIFRAGLGLLALRGFEDYEPAETRFLNRIQSMNLETGGFDDLAMIIIALDEKTPEVIVDQFKSRLFENLNAPSLAHAIMALLILGEDPYQIKDDEGVHIVDHLLALRHPSGGFKYDLNASDTDTRQFSSPQSFLTLVILDQWMNQNPHMPYRP